MPRNSGSPWILIAPLAFALSTVSLSQTPQTAAAGPTASSTPAYTPTMTFDVASVRENKEADLHRGITMSGQFTPHTTHLRLTNWTIENILDIAYGVSSYQLEGVPHWPFPTVFVIEAKGDSDADAKMATLTDKQQGAEQQHMLQALLAERFQLKTHWETREGDVFNLVVAKGNSKLGADGSMPPSADEVKNFGEHPVPVLYQRGDHGNAVWVGHGCSMSNLASILSTMFGRPVIDKTGLTGKYDFAVKYAGRFDSDRKADDANPTLPLDQALQHDLGLKVEPAKGPIQHLVIDHIEKPTPN